MSFWSEIAPLELALAVTSDPGPLVPVTASRREEGGGIRSHTVHQGLETLKRLLSKGKHNQTHSKAESQRNKQNNTGRGAQTGGDHDFENSMPEANNKKNMTHI